MRGRFQDIFPFQGVRIPGATHPALPEVMSMLQQLVDDTAAMEAEAVRAEKSPPPQTLPDRETSAMVPSKGRARESPIFK